MIPNTDHTPTSARAEIASTGGGRWLKFAGFALGIGCLVMCCEWWLARLGVGLPVALGQPCADRVDL